MRQSPHEIFCMTYLALNMTSGDYIIGSMFSRRIWSHDGLDTKILKFRPLNFHLIIKIIHNLNNRNGAYLANDDKVMYELLIPLKTEATKCSVVFALKNGVIVNWEIFEFLILICFKLAFFTHILLF